MCTETEPGSVCRLLVTLAFEILARSPLGESGRVAAGNERKTLGTPFQSPFRKSVRWPSAPPPARPGPRCIVGLREVPSQGATLDSTATCEGTPATSASATASGARRGGPGGVGGALKRRAHPPLSAVCFGPTAVWRTSSPSLQAPPDTPRAGGCGFSLFCHLFKESTFFLLLTLPEPRTPQRRL